MAASLLEDYVTACEDVPGRLQRAFDSIRTLDEEDAGLLSNINALVASRLAEAPPTASDKPTDGAAAAGPSSKAGGPAAGAKKGKSSGGASSAPQPPGGVTSPMAVDAATQSVLDHIAAASGTLADHGGTRCGLAKDCYDFVDALIVRLDKDLAACDAELVKHTQAAAGGAAGGRRGKDGGAAAALATLPPGASPALPGAAGQGNAADVAFAAGRSDLAVDPAEPVYCMCQQVSFGDMIACENESCPIEWFHYECVGLLPGQGPKGKWYCSICKPPKVSLKLSTGAAAIAVPTGAAAIAVQQPKRAGGGGGKDGEAQQGLT